MAVENVNCVTIRGPLRRADLPGLYTRVCLALDGQAGGVLVCDAAQVASDAIAVEALCRLRLGARRHGREVCLANASPGLLDLVTFLGLGDVIRVDRDVLRSRTTSGGGVT
jgi:ABC-type transporter Mla MlaB component